MLNEFTVRLICASSQHVKQADGAPRRSIVAEATLINYGPGPAMWELSSTSLGASWKRGLAAYKESTGLAGIQAASAYADETDFATARESTVTTWVRATSGRLVILGMDPAAYEREDEDFDPTPVKYEITCRFCRLNFQRRADVMHEALDQVRQLGVEEITING